MISWVAELLGKRGSVRPAAGTRRATVDHACVGIRRYADMFPSRASAAATAGPLTRHSSSTVQRPVEFLGRLLEVGPALADRMVLLAAKLGDLPALHSTVTLGRGPEESEGLAELRSFGEVECDNLLLWAWCPWGCASLCHRALRFLSLISGVGDEDVAGLAGDA